MSDTRSEILAAARGILTEHSLADLTMRRLATEVGVSPNAIYWHFADKQTMLAALADDLLTGVPVPDELPWDESLAMMARQVRQVLLAVPDSAEVVSSAWASGLARNDLATRLAALAQAGGLEAAAAAGTATALCQLIVGLTIEEQTRAQMERLGVTGPSGRDYSGEFTAALQVILAGARAIRSDPGGS
ncbi:putative TetR family transcriptional regulator [Gordonia hirsuta DSM 44140 = NBRC 16056]|uniref:Putative TetR family transcriptional regulator n=1 Tax=Gordonia hirsuta DSM 44140 = NBRC 16056 TaxID=1121927 RepID=L7L576_9ACTN|nr:helix-turn-helix domain-containing protein [Gordonia hirsuta]GAC55911.1 putative TetR family transcriptional regulator [Gordonia hirsuta DSM 44140 = NBRC 16056]